MEINEATASRENANIGILLEFNQCSNSPLPESPLLLLHRSTIFTRLNSPGVYFKLSQLNPAFIRGRRLIGARHLLTECNFLSFFQVDFLLPIPLPSSLHSKRFRGVFCTKKPIFFISLFVLFSFVCASMSLKAIFLLYKRFFPFD